MDGILLVVKDVYKNDAEAARQGLTDDQRLHWHQSQSGAKMAKLKAWLTEQIQQHKVEPNSSLGEAIGYMLRHWDAVELPANTDHKQRPAINRGAPPQPSRY